MLYTCFSRLPCTIFQAFHIRRNVLLAPIHSFIFFSIPFSFWTYYRLQNLETFFSQAFGLCNYLSSKYCSIFHLVTFFTTKLFLSLLAPLPKALQKRTVPWSKTLSFPFRCGSGSSDKTLELEVRIRVSICVHYRFWQPAKSCSPSQSLRPTWNQPLLPWEIHQNSSFPKQLP